MTNKEIPELTLNNISLSVSIDIFLFTDFKII